MIPASPHLSEQVIPVLIRHSDITNQNVRPLLNRRSKLRERFRRCLPS